MTKLALEETINEVFVTLENESVYCSLQSIIKEATENLPVVSAFSAEDAIIAPATLSAWMAAESAYKRGYNDALNVEKVALKQKYTEVQSVHHYCAWTRNPLLVKQHDVEFRDYLLRLHPTLRQACELLADGMSMKAVAQQLGFSDQRTLKGRLQKAFGDFLKTVGGGSVNHETPSNGDLQAV